MIGERERGEKQRGEEERERERRSTSTDLPNDLRPLISLEYFSRSSSLQRTVPWARSTIDDEVSLGRGLISAFRPLLEFLGLISFSHQVYFMNIFG